MSEPSRRGFETELAMALMLLATLGALAAVAGSIGTASAASAEKMVVELWRTYGFVVFAGLLVLWRGWRREGINSVGQPR
jgi:hypothetical protein